MWMHFNTTEYLSTTWTFIPSIHANILSNSRLWLKECWRQKCWHSIQPSVVCSLGRWPLMEKCFLWRCSRGCCMRSMRALKYLQLRLTLSLHKYCVFPNFPLWSERLQFQRRDCLAFVASYIHTVRTYIAPLKAVTFGLETSIVRSSPPEHVCACACVCVPFIYVYTYVTFVRWLPLQCHWVLYCLVLHGTTVECINLGPAPLYC